MKCRCCGIDLPVGATVPSCGPCHHALATTRTPTYLKCQLHKKRYDPRRGADAEARGRE